MNKWIVVMVVSALLFIGSLGLLLDSNKSIGTYMAPLLWLAVFLWANQKRTEKKKPNVNKEEPK